MSLPWLTVLTTPRRPQYLRGTLVAIDAAGGYEFVGRKAVFVDGPSVPLVPLVPAGWEVLSLTDGGPSRGTRRSMFEILHRAAGAGADELLYFEDDVYLCRNAVHAIRAFRFPADVGVLSFFQMNRGGPSAPGVHRFTGPAFWGSQALKFPARSLALFAGEDEAPLTDDLHSGDIWIGQLLRMAIVLPTIVRHLGEESAILATRSLTLGDAYRAGLNYAGDHFDALSILAVSP